MKRVVGTLAMVALVGLTVGARANELLPQGYTNTDLNGGYACNLSGRLAGAGAVVGIAQYRPRGDGTFSESALALHLGGIGICRYSLKQGTGTYDLSANGTGLAQLTYALQPKSAKDCPAVFPIHLVFVTSGTTCDIATLDTGVLLSGTCKKQDR